MRYHSLPHIENWSGCEIFFYIHCKISNCHPSIPTLNWEQSCNIFYRFSFFCLSYIRKSKTVVMFSMFETNCFNRWWSVGPNCCSTWTMKQWLWCFAQNIPKTSGQMSMHKIKQLSFNNSSWMQALYCNFKNTEFNQAHCIQNQSRRSIYSYVGERSLNR